MPTSSERPTASRSPWSSLPCATSFTRNPAVGRIRRPDRLLFSRDPSKRTLDGRGAQTLKRQTQEKADAPVERHEGVAKCALDLRIRTWRVSRIRNSPMRRYRLARPHRTDFPRRVIAQGEDKIHRRGPRFRKFIPTLAAQSFGGQSDRLELLQCVRVNESRWPKFVTERVKTGLSPLNSV